MVGSCSPLPTILINFLSIMTFHFIFVVRKQSVLSFALDSVSDPTCCVVQWAVVNRLDYNGAFS